MMNIARRLNKRRNSTQPDPATLEETPHLCAATDLVFVDHGDCCSLMRHTTMSRREAIQNRCRSTMSFRRRKYGKHTDQLEILQVRELCPTDFKEICQCSSLRCVHLHDPNSLEDWDPTTCQPIENATTPGAFSPYPKRQQEVS